MPRTRVFVVVAMAVAASISCSSGAPAAPPAEAGAAAATPAKGRGLPEVPELPKPAFTEVVVPGGTSFDVALDGSLASDRNRIEDAVRGHVVADVVIRGRTAIPQGTAVTGTVLQATPAGREGGHAALALRFLEIQPRGDTVRIRTERIARDAETADANVRLPEGTTFHLSLDDAIRVQVPTE